MKQTPQEQNVLSCGHSLKYDVLETADGCDTCKDYIEKSRQNMTKQDYIDVAVRYFPDALAELGKHSVESNIKHNGKDAPIEWTRHIANDHVGSLKRHLGIPEITDLSHMLEIDEESGSPHAVSSAWRNLALNQIRIEEQ